LALFITEDFMMEASVHGQSTKAGNLRHPVMGSTQKACYTIDLRGIFYVW